MRHTEHEEHDAAGAFLAEFGGLDVQISGPGITCAKTPFNFDPDNLIGEEDRFAGWSDSRTSPSASEMPSLFRAARPASLPKWPCAPICSRS